MPKQRKAGMKLIGAWLKPAAVRAIEAAPNEGEPLSNWLRTAAEERLKDMDLGDMLHESDFKPPSRIGKGGPRPKSSRAKPSAE